MSDQTLAEILVASATAIALLILGIYIRRRTTIKRRRQVQELALLEKARSATPPTGNVLVRTNSDAADRSGRIQLVLVGDFGIGLGAPLLSSLVYSGLDGAIGSVLAIQADERRRELFAAAVPDVFRPKLVTVNFPSMSSGIGDEHPKRVKSEFINLYGPAVLKGATEVSLLHQRLHHGEEPGLVLVMVGGGGQAVTGTVAVEKIARLAPKAKFYGFTALPVDDRLLERMEFLLDEYRQVGVQGFVVADNRLDEVRNDFGMRGAILGFAAAERADTPVEQNNAWYLLFREEPGGLVSYSTYVRQVPGYRLQPTHPSVPPKYYVYENSVISAIHTGLSEVHQPEYRAVSPHLLTATEPKTSRFELVITAVVPADLKNIEDDIVLGLQLKGQDKRNYHLLFASVPTQIGDPDRAVCPVAVVSLASIKDPTAALKHMTAPVAIPQLRGKSPNGSDHQAEPQTKPSAVEALAPVKEDNDHVGT